MFTTSKNLKLLNKNRNTCAFTDWPLKLRNLALALSTLNRSLNFCLADFFIPFLRAFFSRPFSSRFLGLSFHAHFHPLLIFVPAFHSSTRPFCHPSRLSGRGGFSYYKAIGAYIQSLLFTHLARVECATYRLGGGNSMYAKCLCLQALGLLYGAFAIFVHSVK